MKISTKGRYGVRILLDLLAHRDDAPRLIRDIAESQQISAKYVSTLVVALRRAGLVRSLRGANGGFQLACDPGKTTLLEIVEAMEGRVCLVACVDQADQCRRSGACPARGVWARLNDRIRKEMRGIVLRDLRIDRATGHPSRRGGA